MPLVSQHVSPAGDAAYQCDPTRTGQLDDAVGPHQLDEGLDLALLPGDFHHQRLHANVHHSAAKHFDEEHDFHPLLRRRVHLDQHQVALDEVLAADVVNFDD